MRRFIIPFISLVAIGLLVACNSGSKAPKPSPSPLGSATLSNASTATAVPYAGRDPSVSFSSVCQKSDQKLFPRPDVVIDQNMTYIATIKTAKGKIVVQLDPRAAPQTTNSFVFLACKGFYDGLTFHRVIPGFVAQGGDPAGDGTGGPGYSVPGEFAGSNFVTGVVGLARSSSPSSGGSQFFIMLGDSPRLNDQYTAFGKVTSGMNVAQSLTKRDPSIDPSVSPPPGDKIESITIQEK